MGLGESTKALLNGSPSDAFNFLFLSDDQINTARENDSRLIKIVQEDQAKGIINAEDANSLYLKMSTNTLDDNLRGKNSPLNTFSSGYKSDLYGVASSIGGAGKGALDTVFGVVVRAIPWQVWLIGFAILAFFALPYISPVLLSLWGGRKSK